MGLQYVTRITSFYAGSRPNRDLQPMLGAVRNGSPAAPRATFLSASQQRDVALVNPRSDHRSQANMHNEDLEL